MSNKLASMAKGVRTAFVKHSPEILTGIGITGMFTTTILAVQATPKALRLLEEKRETDEELKPIDVVKTCWKCYIPATVTGVMSTACLIGASSVNAKRNAALATAYTISETALAEYREKVIETIGEKKEKKVREEISRDKLKKNPPSQQNIIVTGQGTTTCYDELGGRYFTSSMEQLKKVENDLNRRMRDEMVITLNDFYTEVGLDPVEVGDHIGWDIDKGYLELDFSSLLAPDGTPCLVVGFISPPQYNI